MRFTFERRPTFWLFQSTGWAAYGIALALSSIPVATDLATSAHRGALAYRAGLWATSLAASFVLRVVCRREWRRGFRFPQSILIVFAWCSVLACVCSALAIKAEYAAEGNSIEWFVTLAGAPSAGFILLSWSALYFGIKYYLAAEGERHRALNAEKSAREAELRALRYQIHPHFLFNTLNAISTLVVEGQSEAATGMITRLADFFRATLQEDKAEQVELQDELFLSEQYLAIERLRLGDRLSVEIDVPLALLECRVPHLILQPLVENAIRHGIAPRLGPGRLAIEADKNDGLLIVKVTDDGLGKGSRKPLKDDRGIGLNNIDKRLRELYGSKGRLQLMWPDAGGCQAILQIPYHENGQALPPQ